MKLPVLASVIAIAIFITLKCKSAMSKEKDADKKFWAREAQANSVRRKSLDELHYIHIPLKDFPTDFLKDDSSVQECINVLESLSSQKIVNLTGWSNTDLKLEYGTANIGVLSEYDQNYTLLARTLQIWADKLIEAGHMDEASVLMEFAISTETDVSRTYYLLADYWASQGEYTQIERLIETADKLRSANKSAIIRHLTEQYGHLVNGVFWELNPELIKQYGYLLNDSFREQHPEIASKFQNSLRKRK